MSIEQIKLLLTILDFPSGVVLTIHTLVMIGISIAAHVQNRPIDGSIITVYGIVLGCFAANKTYKMVQDHKTQGTVHEEPKA